MNSSQLKEELKSKRKQLEGIKRRLNRSCQEQTHVYDIMRKRVHRHQELGAMKGKNQPYGWGQCSNKVVNNQTTNQPYININSINQSDNKDLFSLQLNKQIVYFMVDESIKRQQKLGYQQRLKQQLKQTQPDKILSQGEQKQPDNIAYSQNIDNKQESLPFIFIQQLRPQRVEIPIPHNQQELLDLERLFSMPEDENLEIMYELQQPDNNFFLRLREHISSISRHQLLRTNENSSARNQQNNSNKIMVDLEYTRKDLFDENKFIETIDKADTQRQGRMKQEHNREGNHSSQQHQINHHVNNSYTTNYSTFQVSLFNYQFQDQLQLQCTLYRKQNQISHQILANNLNTVTQFLYENNHMINKSNSHLQFWLTLCKAVELIATKIQSQQMKALQIIRNMISKLKSKLENWQKDELQKVTCMLLMQQEKIFLQPYLKKTQQSFRTVFQQIYKLPDFDQFLHTIYTGALILKTPTCIEKDKENPLICPLCNPLAEKVFTNIPLLTRNQSNLICRINGSVMDHENYPIMLPSYQIYSLKGLQETKKRAKVSSGKVIEEYYCKFTQTWYNKQLAKKVFLA